MSLFGRRKLPLTDEEQDRVVERIQKAEAGTTGELRIFMEAKCKYVNPIDRAKEVFEELGMVETERRNAVLLYMAYDDHQFAILGDKEIYEQAGGPSFWKTAAQHLQDHLREGQMTEGICACIDELGNALAKHFPFDPSITKNELPDEIVFGK